MMQQMLVSGSATGYYGPPFNQTYYSNTTITIPNGVTYVNYIVHGGKGGQGGSSSGGQGPTFGNQSGAVLSLIHI